MITSKRLHFFLTLLICILLLALIYPHIVFHANDFLFSTYSDGVKNYYNFAYHIKNDASYFYFNGMHYPYGEYFQFVDFQPALGMPLKLISRHMVDLSPYSIGIMNLVMLFSIAVAAAFLHLIFNHFGISGFNAVAAAIAISFLCSQPLLWQWGHYGLSYVSFIPLSWYVMISYIKNPQKKSIWFIMACNSFFWFFMHTYLGFIVTAFNLLVFLFFYVGRRNELNVKKWLLAAFIGGLLPILIVFVLMVLFDTKTGRIELPLDVNHRATFYNVFLPRNAWTKPLYNLIFNVENQQNSLWSKNGNYIGLATNLMLVWAFMAFVYKGFKKKLKVRTLFQREFSIYLAASVCILIFAMAILQQSGLKKLFEIIPQIKQLVGIGRFAWVFFFVITVYSYFLIQKLFKKQVATYLMLAASLLTFSEGLSNHLHLRKTTSENQNIFNKEHERQLNSTIKNVDYKDYQAILCLPFHHGYITAHNFIPTDKSINFSMQLSYVTGMPQFFALLSRPSQTEARHIVQLFAPPYYKKEVLNQLPDSRPILITYSGDDLTPYEQAVLESGIPLYENDEYMLAHLNLDSLRYFNKNYYKNLFNQAVEYKNGISMDDTLSYFHFQDYEEFHSTKSWNGRSALNLSKRKGHVIFTEKRKVLKPDKNYEISFWYYSHLYDQSFTTVNIALFDSLKNKVYNTGFDPIRPCTFTGNWVFNKCPFHIKHAGDSVSVKIKGGNFYSDSLWIDDVMVREITNDIFIPEYKAGTLFSLRYNNERIF